MLTEEFTMTFDKVKEIIMDVLKFDGDVTMESTLEGDLQADSLDAVELAMAIEEEFDVEIPDDVLPNMETVGDLVEYIDANL